MRYYGVVNHLRQKPGWYGREDPTRPAVEKVAQSTANAVWREKSTGDELLSVLQTLFKYTLLGQVVDLISRLAGSNKTPLHRIHPLEGKTFCLVSNGVLAGDYDLSEDDQTILHGLIAESPKFKALMRSEGGSELFVLERSHLSALGLKHYGGEGGQFSPGIYCEHPKDNAVLLPLGTASEILKSEILEETVRVFEALGATHILIEDVTEVTGAAGGGDGKVKAEANFKAEKKVLREMQYDPLTPVDAARALRGKRHVHDLPNVMSIVEARTHGNQTLQRFEETIAVHCGLDVNVLGMFGAKMKGGYTRRWSFEVRFRSKQ